MAETVLCDDHDDIVARHKAEGRTVVPITTETAAKVVTPDDEQVVTKPARKPAKKTAAKKA